MTSTTTLSLSLLHPSRSSHSGRTASSTFSRTILMLIAAGFLSLPNRMCAQVYVGNYYNNSVSEYDATTGQVLSANFITGVDEPEALALSGNNLYIVNGGNSTVGVYNAATGAAINASLFTEINIPEGILVSGNAVYVTTFAGTVAEYNATTGVVINDNLITGLQDAQGLAISGNNLYVASGNVVGKYNATTGQAINSSFIGEHPNAPTGLAISGNHLFVSGQGTGGDLALGEYDATTGAAIKANFVNGLSDPYTLSLSGNLLFEADVGTDTIGVYNATTGATVNSSLIVGSGQNEPYAMVAVFVPEPTASILLFFGAVPLFGRNFGRVRRGAEEV